MLKHIKLVRIAKGYPSYFWLSPPKYFLWPYFIITAVINKLNICIDLSIPDAIDRACSRVLRYWVKADGQSFQRSASASSFAGLSPVKGWRRRKVKTVTKEDNPKITTAWRFTDAKLSPAWLRLVRKLTASREGRPRNTPPDASEGKCNDEDEQPISNL